MTSTTPADRGASPLGGALFTLAVFFSAALVFLVEPMITRMILPRLGGSSAVWNTALAFFQIALLAGYAYADVLQRLASMRAQMGVHLAVLVAAAVVLPLHITGLLGDPSVQHPALWLLAALTLSLGAPFAALSATAPLMQAWYARTHGLATGKDPYVLYAASNLGSLLALLAYPLLVEPNLRLGTQSMGWSLGYGLFGLVAAGIVWINRRAAASPSAPVPGDEAGAHLVGWRDRIVWLLLAAAPSSLLLGVTGHITSDIASAPFLWVIPLALYLLGFIIAFQSRPLMGGPVTLLLQAGFLPGALVLFAVPAAPLFLQLPVHLLAFFLTALVCAQSLAARRPPTDKLTEFYLWMSIGGVVGGAFNAFAAPLLFSGYWEYPIVLVLACLARPSIPGVLRWYEWLLMAVAVAGAATLLALPGSLDLSRDPKLALLAVPAVCAALLMRRAAPYAVALACLGVASYVPNLMRPDSEEHRSFFGVVQVARVPTPILGSALILVHGSTLHGTEGLAADNKCLPTTYYAPPTPIGQVMRQEQARHRALAIGAVGLGTGTIAAYVRPADRLRFFEIDPMIVRLSYNGARFRYVKDCAKGPVDLTLGDARLSLEKAPDASFDVLLVDAFSSDSVPTHLMTVQAMRTYLRVIKPGGIVILHLSNRNLELGGPVAASMKAAGGAMLEQAYFSPAGQTYVQSSSQAIIAARAPADLAPYRAQPQWFAPRRVVRAWTDDYTNVLGAVIARLKERRRD